MKKQSLCLLLLVAACTAGNVRYEERIIIEEPYLPESEKRYIGAPERDLGITPSVYAIAATRATNKMLDESTDIYENNNSTFLYIMDPKKTDDSLPDGFYYARKTTRDIIEGSRTFKVVNNLNDADYYLEVLVENAGNDETPVIAYRMILFDKDNVKINEWVETVRRLKNDDRSWW